MNPEPPLGSMDPIAGSTAELDPSLGLGLGLDFNPGLGLDLDVDFDPSLGLDLDVDFDPNLGFGLDLGFDPNLALGFDLGFGFDAQQVDGNPHDPPSIRQDLTTSSVPALSLDTAHESQGPVEPLKCPISPQMPRRVDRPEDDPKAIVRWIKLNSDIPTPELEARLRLEDQNTIKALNRDLSTFLETPEYAARVVDLTQCEDRDYKRYLSILLSLDFLRSDGRGEEYFGNASHASPLWPDESSQLICDFVVFVYRNIRRSMEKERKRRGREKEKATDDIAPSQEEQPPVPPQEQQTPAWIQYEFWPAVTPADFEREDGIPASPDPFAEQPTRPAAPALEHGGSDMPGSLGRQATQTATSVAAPAPLASRERKRRGSCVSRLPGKRLKETNFEIRKTAFDKAVIRDLGSLENATDFERGTASKFYIAAIQQPTPPELPMIPPMIPTIPPAIPPMIPSEPTPPAEVVELDQAEPSTPQPRGPLTSLAKLAYSVWFVDAASNRRLPVLSLGKEEGLWKDGFASVYSHCMGLGIKPVIEILTPGAGFVVVKAKKGWDHAVDAVRQEPMMERIVKVRLSERTIPVSKSKSKSKPKTKSK